jgi:hypothetical protein
MTKIFEASKKMGRWYLDLCGQRWVYCGMMVWLLSKNWEGSLQSTINAHYWVSVCCAITVSLLIIAALLRFCAVVVNRGDATVVHAIKADLQRRWASRPTLVAFLRGPISG